MQTEDRIKFSQEAKEHFVKLAKEQNFDAAIKKVFQKIKEKSSMLIWIRSMHL